MLGLDGMGEALFHKTSAGAKTLPEVRIFGLNDRKNRKGLHRCNPFPYQPTKHSMRFHEPARRSVMADPHHIQARFEPAGAEPGHVRAR